MSAARRPGMTLAPQITGSMISAQVLLPAALSASIDAEVPFAPGWSELVAELSRGERPTEPPGPATSAERTLAAGVDAAWQIHATPVTDEPCACAGCCGRGRRPLAPRSGPRRFSMPPPMPSKPGGGPPDQTLVTSAGVLRSS